MLLLLLRRDGLVRGGGIQDDLGGLGRMAKKIFEGLQF